MTVKFSNPEVARFIDQQVHSGAYPTADALFEDAITRMMEEKSPTLTAEDWDAIAESDAEIERGETIDFDLFVSQLKYRLIVKSAAVCGGAARFSHTRIPVWIVERMRQLGVSEVDIMRNYPTLRAADIARAWEYVEAHPAEIAEAISTNEEDQ